MFFIHSTSLERFDCIKFLAAKLHFCFLLIVAICGPAEQDKMHLNLNADVSKSLQMLESVKKAIDESDDEKLQM